MNIFTIYKSIYSKTLFSCYSNERGGLYFKIKTKWWAISILCLLLASCSENKSSINIAVASNFEPTLKKIIQFYPNKQIEINIISASSGVLSNQILNNAPYDLFLSADTSKPALIYRKLNLETNPVVYAIGKLALWVPKSSGKNCLQKLSKVKTLAIPNPKTAPYGKAAQSILSTMKTPEKIIQTANASQAYNYTKDGLTQAGFVPYSTVLKEKIGCLEIFEQVKLKQGMVLLNKKAQLLFDFIKSSKIKKVIKEEGYW